MASEEQVREQLVAFGKRMYERGYVAANDGNLSARLGQGLFLATPTGVSKGFMKPEEMVKIDVEGRPVGPGNVSTEIKMHLAVYRARPDVHGVVHAHPPISTAFSLSNRELNPHLLAEVVVSLGAIPVAAYRTPSTQELAEIVQQYIVHHEAVLMSNHGAITVGANLQQAYFRLETLEHCALINLISHQLGGGRSLPQAEIERLMGMREYYGVAKTTTPTRLPVETSKSYSGITVDTISTIVGAVLTRIKNSGTPRS